MSIFQSQPIVKFLASGFYAGYSPLAPGTAGSLVGVLAYLLLQNLSNAAYITIVILIALSGIYLSGKAEDIYQVKDSRYIVIDEIAGMLITFIFLPKGINFLFAGFVSFRIFDILKPFPIGLIDRRLEGGWGIMLDDVLAGVYANLLVRVLNLTLPLDGGGVGWG